MSSNEYEYEVVYPGGRNASAGLKHAKRLDTLEGKVIAELWDRVFKGDMMFKGIEDELKRRYPGIKFVSWENFGSTHGAPERQTLAELPAKLKEFGVDAVLSAAGC